MINFLLTSFARSVLKSIGPFSFLCGLEPIFPSAALTLGS